MNEEQRTMESYFELKKRKAKEQGKNFWFEAILTDEEANLRLAEDSRHSCLFCKSSRDTARHCANICLLNHNITNTHKQICDEWRYVF